MLFAYGVLVRCRMILRYRQLQSSRVSSCLVGRPLRHQLLLHYQMLFSLWDDVLVKYAISYRV